MSFRYILMSFAWAMYTRLKVMMTIMLFRFSNEPSVCTRTHFSDKALFHTYLWSAVCKNLWGQRRQCMYDVPSLICCMPCFIYLCHDSYIYAMICIYLCHVLYIYVMFYIFMPWFIYLCHVLYIYAMFYIFMSISIHVASLFIYAAPRFPFLLYCVLSFMLYQLKFMLYQLKFMLH